MADVTIVPFSVEFNDAFAQLNREWIERIFTIELPREIFVG